jgi:prepilin-type N-terminal cleavage/methylation domain-containing protein
MLVRDRRGMTLIEVMVVVALLAILIGAAYTLLGNVLSVMRVRGVVEQSVTAIRLARQSAITTGEYRCITFTTSDPPSYAITTATSVSNCTATPVTDIPGERNLGESGVDYIWATPPLVMIFDPTGRTWANGGTNQDVVFSVDTVPASCWTSVTVTIYGGARVTGKTGAQGTC